MKNARGITKNFSEIIFQSSIKIHFSKGVMLSICSKFN